MNTNANNFYTVEEVASLLKVHPNTVRGWIRQGKLNAIKINTLTRIREADLEIFMKPFKGRASDKTGDAARYKG